MFTAGLDMIHRSAASSRFIQTSNFVEQLYLTHILSQYSSLYVALLQNLMPRMKYKNAFKSWQVGTTRTLPRSNAQRYNEVFLSPLKKGKEMFLSSEGAGEFFDRVIHYCFVHVMPLRTRKMQNIQCLQSKNRVSE